VLCCVVLCCVVLCCVVLCCVVLCCVVFVRGTHVREAELRGCTTGLASLPCSSACRRCLGSATHSAAVRTAHTRHRPPNPASMPARTHLHSSPFFAAKALPKLTWPGTPARWARLAAASGSAPPRAAQPAGGTAGSCTPPAVHTAYDTHMQTRVRVWMREGLHAFAGPLTSAQRLPSVQSSQSRTARGTSSPAAAAAALSAAAPRAPARAPARAAAPASPLTPPSAAAAAKAEGEGEQGEGAFLPGEPL
jgi:hypothetical protein